MRSMFAYICLGSNDLERSAAFYDATLGALGYSRCDTSAESETSWSGWIGWGLYEKEGAVQDALWVCKPFNGAPASVGNGSMVALWAKTGRQSMRFTRRRWRTAEPRKARRVCACYTTRISTRPTCAIRMATNSPWYAGASHRLRGNSRAREKVTSWLIAALGSSSVHARRLHFGVSIRATQAAARKSLPRKSS